MRSPVRAEPRQVTERRFEGDAEAIGERNQCAHRLPRLWICDRLGRVGAIPLELVMEQASESNRGFEFGVLLRRRPSQVLHQREIELLSAVFVEPEVVGSHANERTRRGVLSNMLLDLNDPAGFDGRPSYPRGMRSPMVRYSPLDPYLDPYRPCLMRLMRLLDALGVGG